MLRVTARTDWLEKPVTYEIAPGMSLEEIVMRAPGLPEHVLRCGTIAVNGEPVPRAWWGRVRPREGTFADPVIVTIHPETLQGGGGGGGGSKQVLTIVATLALVAGTAFIGAGGLALLGASSSLFGATGSLTAYAAAGFGIAGQLALTALAPPPVAANQKNRKQEADRLAGIQANTAEPHGLLSRAVGTVVMSPPFVARPWTELVDGVVTANAICGLAGHYQIGEILLNGVDAAEMPDVEIETREGGHVEIASVMQDDPLTLITRCGIEQAGVAMSEFDLERKDGNTDRLVNQTDPEQSAPKWHTFQTVGSVDEAIIRLVMPAGAYMVNASDDNKQERVGVPFVVQFKASNSSVWINGPEIHISPLKKFAKLLRQRIRLVWEADPGGSLSSRSSEDYACFVAYGYTGTEAFSWTANSYFRQTGTLKAAKNCNIDRDGLTIYLDPATFPQGKYDVRIKRGILYRLDNFDAATHEHNGSAAGANFFGYVLDGPHYEVKIDQEEKTGAVQVETFTCIRNTHPVPDGANLCLFAVKARYERIESISVRLTSRARLWDGSAWGSSYEPTANPAALYREVLLGPLNARPVDAAMVNDESLGEAYEDCEARGYVANGILQSVSVEQALQAIAAAAFGVPRQEETWDIMLERDTSSQAPVQILSPRIVRNMTIERAFTPLPHALRAEFLNEQNDYRPDELFVYRAGYDASNATLYNAINYAMFTDPALVAARAQFDMNQLVYRQKTYSGDMNWAHLVSPRGTLVGWSMDGLGTVMSSAIIVSVTRSAGNITGLALDAEVTSPVSNAGVTVQLSTSGTVTRQISPVAGSKVITFLTPFADPGTIEPGKLVAVGAFTTTMRRCKVFDIERLPDLQARVTLVDEAPEIHA